MSSRSPGGASPEAHALLDPARLSALAGSGLLDSEAEASFDRLTALASRVTGAEVSLIALVDADRAYFKSCHGLPVVPPGRTVPLSHSLCRHVAAAGEPVAVPDAREHPLFSENGAVTEMGVRAYFGVPLRSPSGHVLGSLCAIDLVPREWTDDDRETLLTLAESAERELALRQRLAERDGELALRERERAAAAAEADALAAVLGVNARLAAELDPDRLVQSVVDAGTERTGAAFGSFFYSPHRGGNAALFAVSGAPREAFERLGDVRMTPLFEPSFSGRHAVRSDDVAADPRYGRMGGMPRGHLPVRSYLSVPVRGPEGEPLGALLFGHPEPGVFDEHDERVAEAIAVQAAIALQNARLHRALDESERQHRLVLANLRDVVFQTDAEGRYTFLNGAWAERTGHALSETLGRHAFRFLAPEEDPSALAEIVRTHTRQAAPGGNDAPDRNGAPEREAAPDPEPSFRHPVRVRHADGSTLHFEAEWRRTTDEDGRHSGWVGTYTDVTDTVRYHAERAARRAADRARVEAERAARLQQAFLANMSHEIRTPLTAIIGSAELLAEEAPERLSRLAGMVIQGGQRLLGTLNAVLDLAQIEAGRMRPSRRPTDVGTLLRAALQGARPLAEQKGLALELEAQELPALLLDAGLLDRVVANLVGNAVKFTEKGGVRVSATHDGEHLAIAVSDTGIGIAPEHQAHVFDQFRQGSEGAARTHEGNGLGLALARRVARLLGGDVSLESRPGAGSTFTVAVPAPPA